MHERSDNSIEALITRPPEAVTVTDIPLLQEGLVQSAKFLESAAFLEQAMAWGTTEPREAYEAVMARGDEGHPFPELRFAVLTILLRSIERLNGKPAEPAPEVRDLLREVETEMRSSGLVDRARAAEFRSDPGVWLPGASRSNTRLLKPEGCWLIELDGEQLLCVHADSRDPVVAQDAVVAAYDKACREGWRELVVVGAPGVADAIKMPSEFEAEVLGVGITVVEFEMSVGPRPGTGPRPFDGGNA